MFVFAISTPFWVLLWFLLDIRRVTFVCLLFAYGALLYWLSKFSFPWHLVLTGAIVLYCIYLCVKIMIDPDLTRSQKIAMLFGNDIPAPTDKCTPDEKRYDEYCMKNNGYIKEDQD